MDSYLWPSSQSNCPHANVHKSQHQQGMVTEEVMMCQIESHSNNNFQCHFQHHQGDPGVHTKYVYQIFVLYSFVNIFCNFIIAHSKYIHE